VLVDRIDQGGGDIGAAALHDEGHVWSVALFSAISASEGCDLLSKRTSSNFLPSAQPLN